MLKLKPCGPTTNVSILVLVDVGLRLDSITLSISSSIVSILVLVDVGLRQGLFPVQGKDRIKFQSLF